MSLPLQDVRLAAARFAAEGGTRVNAYYTTSTVGTCLNHPKQGKTQSFRRYCSLSELEAIFRNPRVHTRRGYQTKPAPISSSGGRAGGGRSSSNSGGGGAAATASDESRSADFRVETEVKSQLQRVEEEMQELAQEKAHLTGVLDQLEQAKKEEEARRKKLEEEKASRKRELKEEEASRKRRLEEEEEERKR